MPGYAGGTVAADLARLRRMVAESGTATYSDALLIAEIVRYPLPDAAGEWPYLTSGSVNTDWLGAWDFAAVASALWEEKAAAVSSNFNFTADGANFQKSNVYEQYMKNSRHWHSRRAPGNHTAVVYPTEPATAVWIGNLAEDDD